MLRDTEFALAPVTPERARGMIERLNIFPLLMGARSTRPYDVAAVVAAIVSLGQFLAERGAEFAAVDINPLIVGLEGEGAVAVDAKFLVSAR
jgi:acetate---CoA ligase (ADP-forming)